MTRLRPTLLICIAILAMRCAAPAPPPPAVTPTGEDRFLVDPRLGYSTAVPPALDRRFDAAWRYAMAGSEAEARTRLTEINTTNPAYEPAALGLAALDLKASRFTEAQAIVDGVLRRNPDYLAAQIYQAEIALRSGQSRAALDLYRKIQARTGAPIVASERVAALEASIYDELFAAAQQATGPRAIELLRETLTIRPDAVEPRLMLAGALVREKQYEQARRELDPIINATPDRAEVQELLAEIDAGRGRYQEAIVRYDRLARRTGEARYARRLEEIKQEWSAANMPPHYRSALESAALTRAELAVLLYWTVPSIRFAQNLGTPPIAVDVAEVPGRDELVRAIAIGLFDVDPVTRRVGPHRAVTAERFSRFLARTLALRGADCAKGLETDQVLAACGVKDPFAALPGDSPVTGRVALRALEEVGRVLK